jgi:hypothetical protein
MAYFSENITIISDNTYFYDTFSFYNLLIVFYRENFY